MIFKKHRITLHLRKYNTKAPEDILNGYIYTNDNKDVFVSAHFISTFLNTGGTHVLQILNRLYPTYKLIETEGTGHPKLITLKAFYDICTRRTISPNSKVINPIVIKTAFPNFYSFNSFFKELITETNYIEDITSSSTEEETVYPFDLQPVNQQQDQVKLLAPAPTHSIIKDKIDNLVKLIEVKESKLSQARNDLELIISLITDITDNLTD